MVFFHHNHSSCEPTVNWMSNEGIRQITGCLGTNTTLEILDLGGLDKEMIWKLPHDVNHTFYWTGYKEMDKDTLEPLCKAISQGGRITTLSLKGLHCDSHCFFTEIHDWCWTQTGNQIGNDGCRRICKQFSEDNNTTLTSLNLGCFLNHKLWSLAIEVKLCCFSQQYWSIRGGGFRFLAFKEHTQGSRFATFQETPLLLTNSGTFITFLKWWTVNCIRDRGTRHICKALQKKFISHIFGFKQSEMEQFF